MTWSYGERSVEDILAGRLRIRLAGRWYVLPVLTVGQNADWLAGLDAALHPIVDDEDDLEVLERMVEGLNDRLLEFLYSYDVTHVLPPLGSIARDIYPNEPLKAVMEVRLSANPTLGLVLATTAPPPPEPGPASTPTSSWPRRMAGRFGWFEPS